ncbi:MAG: ABC transporter ATP-binding protein [Thermodesulfobacteriota bacterium]
MSLTVGKGAIHALIGPNGAGKTTVLNCLSRFYTPDEGRIIFDDQNLLHLKEYDVAKVGIARTFQNLELFRDLTVFDNVLTARFRFMKAGILENMLCLPRSRRDETRNRERVMEILSLVGLEKRAQVRVGGLPYGLQKIVELARAMALEPKLLLLDEPAAGMNSREVAQLGELLVRLCEILQATILLVEHNMALVMAISHLVTVMHSGQFLAEGTPGQIESDPKVVEAYLGSGYKPHLARSKNA